VALLYRDYRTSATNTSDVPTAEHENRAWHKNARKLILTAVDIVTVPASEFNVRSSNVLVMLGGHDDDVPPPTHTPFPPPVYTGGRGG
jgi:hypothetical protein